jgi:hypothetical protein
MVDSQRPPAARPAAGEALAAQTASAVRAAPPGGGWRWWVGTAAAVFLGALYLVAVWAKAIDPAAFAEQIALEGLDFLVPASWLAGAALVLEAALGVALLVNLRRLWVLVPTALLTVFFLALNLRAWWLDAQGLREDVAGCGCFGNLMDRTPGEALVMDLLLLGVPTLLVFVGRPRHVRRFPPLRTALVAVAGVAAALLAWKAPELPLDDLATRLSPGTTVGEMCAGRDAERLCLDLLVPELAQGEHLVVLADLGDEAFTGSVDAVNDYAMAARMAGAAPLWVLAGGTPEEHRAFFWQYGPVFEVREVPEALLAPLHRRLPRSFRLIDGVVVETWSGLPPLEA